MPVNFILPFLRNGIHHPKMLRTLHMESPNGSHFLISQSPFINMPDRPTLGTCRPRPSATFRSRAGGSPGSALPAATRRPPRPPQLSWRTRRRRRRAPRITATWRRVPLLLLLVVHSARASSPFGEEQKRFFTI